MYPVKLKPDSLYQKKGAQIFASLGLTNLIAVKFHFDQLASNNASGQIFIFRCFLTFSIICLSSDSTIWVSPKSKIFRFSVVFFRMSLWLCHLVGVKHVLEQFSCLRSCHKTRFSFVRSKITKRKLLKHFYHVSVEQRTLDFEKNRASILEYFRWTTLLYWHLMNNYS